MQHLLHSTSGVAAHSPCYNSCVQEISDAQPLQFLLIPLPEVVVPSLPEIAVGVDHARIIAVSVQNKKTLKYCQEECQRHVPLTSMKRSVQSAVAAGLC